MQKKPVNLLNTAFLFLIAITAAVILLEGRAEACPFAIQQQVTSHLQESSIAFQKKKPG